MSDGFMLYLDDDGVARHYDDTYDITIHCESKEEQERAIAHIKSRQWIPCSEGMPDEDYCFGGDVQYSKAALVTVVNHGNEDDAFVCLAYTADGVWQLDYPRVDDRFIPTWCEVVAWMPLPAPAKIEG